VILFISFPTFVSYSLEDLIMAEETAKQQVLVPYDFSEASENALIYGIELARLFRCEVSIIHAISKKHMDKTPEKAEADAKADLITISNNIISKHHLLVNVYVFQGEVHDLINKFYEKINAIAVIAGLNSTKKKNHYFTAGKLVTDYRNLRVPLVVVHDIMPRKTMYSHIILPLDFNRESKEKSAWAGHISTLNKSKVRILIRAYKDAYFAASLRNNLVLVKKLYKNLEVDYDIIKEPDITVDIDKYALEYAWLNNADLLVIMATKDIAVDDLLLGLKEKKIIDNKYKLPVMLINPRDDLYLPCGC
jgi:nucleotide-binding universal stress UspA family protein